MTQKSVDFVNLPNSNIMGQASSGKHPCLNFAMCSRDCSRRLVPLNNKFLSTRLFSLIHRSGGHSCKIASGQLAIIFQRLYSHQNPGLRLCMKGKCFIFALMLHLYYYFSTGCEDRIVNYWRGYEVTTQQTTTTTLQIFFKKIYIQSLES